MMFRKPKALQQNNTRKGRSWKYRYGLRQNPEICSEQDFFVLEDSAAWRKPRRLRENAPSLSFDFQPRKEWRMLLENKK
jgi:hypothetical protein